MRLVFEFDDEWWDDFIHRPSDGLHITVSPYATVSGYGHMTGINVERKIIVESQAGYRRPISRHYETVEACSRVMGTADIADGFVVSCEMVGV